MLGIRLIRGSRPLAMVPWALVCATSAASGFLFLAALAHATAHPEVNAGSLLVRLLWAVVPAAAVAHLAAAVAAADTALPARRADGGLAAAGCGPSRLTLLATGSTAVTCGLGGALGWACFLLLRGDLGAGPWSGAAAHLLGAGDPLPLPATAVLLALTPTAAAASTAAVLRRAGAAVPRSPGDRSAQPSPSGGPRWVTRPRPTPAAIATVGMPPALSTSDVESGITGDTVAERTTDDPAVADPPSSSGPPTAPPEPATPTGQPTSVAAMLPWGAAIAAGGLALEAFASRGGGDAGGYLVALPGALEGLPLGVLAGWSLTAIGLMVTAPGLAAVGGTLLCAGRPGALRLLSGRGLHTTAARLGPPLGVFCAVVSGAGAAAGLYASASADAVGRPLGPLSALGTAIVVVCTASAVAVTALRVRRERRPTTLALGRLGASDRLLRGAAALRGAVLLVLLTPVTWGVTALATVPLPH